MEVMKTPSIPLVGKDKSGDKVYIWHDEDIGKSRCEKHPAGHVMKRKSDGKEVCLFMYDEEMNPITDATEIEDITPEKLEEASEKSVENLEV